jgi:hypothetical protein
MAVRHLIRDWCAVSAKFQMKSVLCIPAGFRSIAHDYNDLNASQRPAMGKFCDPHNGLLRDVGQIAA